MVAVPSTIRLVAMARCAVVLAFLFSTVGMARGDAATGVCEPPNGENPHADPTLTAPKEPAAAAEHLSRGKAAHRVQDFDEAIAEFKAGAKLSSAPVFLYALGQSFRLAGRYDEAIRSYQLFLARARPGTALRAVVECHIGNMKAELDRAARTTPPTDQPPDDNAELPREVVVRHSEAWYGDGVGWALAGGGLAIAATGGVLMLDAARLDEDADTEDREPVRLELRDKASTRRTWGVVATGVGAAVLVGGIIKLAVTPGDNAKRIVVGAGPGDVGLAIAGRF